MYFLLNESIIYNRRQTNEFYNPDGTLSANIPKVVSLRRRRRDRDSKPPTTLAKC